MIKIVLGLRQQAHQVDVITPNEGGRPVLGTSSPEDQDRRATVMRAWGVPPSPRQQRLATIDLPLPQRSATILASRLEPVLRARLDGLGAPGSASRRHHQEGQTAPLALADIERGTGS
ncbi:hypothetical protein [Janthinobacterium sp. PC23-8]|uniref:hypothetical protein n=1 Tax=Janthinobacterium sp. PC23-8 TaxID=2012679 RepID=UPI000B960E10|nr:hypothetical protein [Janthinobacterium sp. PC23-8]OYO27453.1 hypothetical protein CD932_19930 [Janthinobacterium sp. PC23-8]